MGILQDRQDWTCVLNLLGATCRKAQHLVARKHEHWHSWCNPQQDRPFPEVPESCQGCFADAWITSRRQVIFSDQTPCCILLS